MDALTPTSTAPAPAAPAAPAPVPAPMPMTAAPMVASSGSPKQGVKEILKTMNWTEVLFGVLGTATLYFTIYYFRHNIQMSKTFKMDVENKIDDLTMKVSDLSSIINASETKQPQQDLFI